MLWEGGRAVSAGVVEFVEEATLFSLAPGQVPYVSVGSEPSGVLSGLSVTIAHNGDTRLFQTGATCSMEGEVSVTGVGRALMSGHVSCQFTSSQARIVLQEGVDTQVRVWATPSSYDGRIGNGHTHVSPASLTLRRTLSEPRLVAPAAFLPGNGMDPVVEFALEQSDSTDSLICTFCSTLHVAAHQTSSKRFMCRVPSLAAISEQQESSCAVSADRLSVDAIVLLRRDYESSSLYSPFAVVLLQHVVVEMLHSAYPVVAAPSQSVFLEIAGVRDMVTAVPQTSSALMAVACEDRESSHVHVSNAVQVISGRPAVVTTHIPIDIPSLEGHAELTCRVAVYWHQQSEEAQVLTFSSHVFSIRASTWNAPSLNVGLNFFDDASILLSVESSLVDLELPMKWACAYAVNGVSLPLVEADYAATIGSTMQLRCPTEFRSFSGGSSV